MIILDARAFMDKQGITAFTQTTQEEKDAIELAKKKETLERNWGKRVWWCWWFFDDINKRWKNSWYSRHWFGSNLISN